MQTPRPILHSCDVVQAIGEGVAHSSAMFDLSVITEALHCRRGHTHARDGLCLDADNGVVVLQRDHYFLLWVGVVFVVSLLLLVVVVVLVLLLLLLSSLLLLVLLLMVVVLLLAAVVLLLVLLLLLLFSRKKRERTNF